MTTTTKPQKNRVQMVSVVMPIYLTNHTQLRYFEEAVFSVLNQTWNNLELIIINDASPINPNTILAKFTDQRIRILENGKNLGIAQTRNTGFANAVGEFIANMDQDDISHPKRIATQVEYMIENTKIAAIGTQVILINKNTEIIGAYHYPVSHEQLKKEIGTRSPLCNPSVLMRKSHLEKTGPLKTLYSSAEEYDKWFELINMGFVITNTREQLFFYRQYPEQHTFSGLKKQLFATQLVQMKWLTNPHYQTFSILHLAMWLLRWSLFLLPKNWIYKLSSVFHRRKESISLASSEFKKADETLALFRINRNTKPTPRAVVVIPAYNEATVIENTINDLMLNDLRDIVVVDDGSLDGTTEICKKIGVTIITHPINMGVGSATRSAIEWVMTNTNATHILTFDADGQMQATDAIRVLDIATRNNYPFIYGARNFNTPGTPLKRKLVGKLADLLTFLISGKYVRDTQSGLHCIHVDLLRKLSLTSTGYTICSELVIEAIKNGVIPHPVEIEAKYTNYSLAKGQRLSNMFRMISSLLK